VVSAWLAAAAVAGFPALGASITTGAGSASLSSDLLIAAISSGVGMRRPAMVPSNFRRSPLGALGSWVTVSCAPGAKVVGIPAA
jgi:hypothetical protein